MTERLTPEALAALPTVTFPSVSHQGDQVAFYADWTGRFELYVLDLRTGHRRQVTDGQAPTAPRGGYVWSHDDTRLYFCRDEDGNERQALFELTLATGGVRALSHAPESMDYAAEVRPDGSQLLVNSTRGGQMNVHVYDLARDGDSAWTALTHFASTAMASGWSPDGSRIALTSNESPDLQNTDGYVVRGDGSEIRRVFRVREGSRDTLGDWHPDGERLAVSSDATGNSRVGVLTLATGEVRWFTPEESQVEETPGGFSPDGRWLSALRNVDSTLTAVLYDTRTGQERPVLLPPGVVTSLDFALGSAGLLVQHSTTVSRPALLLYDLGTETSEVVVPADHGALDPAQFTQGRFIHYPTTDGLQVPALLYTPRTAQPGQMFPALINVHGGPTGQFFQNFSTLDQLLADQGYVVLCPNVRGSTGSGVAWRDANLLDWGGRDLEDITAGAEYLKTLGEVDPARLGIFGISYGGYLSYLAAVKRPELFKVSVPIVGISDLQQLNADNSRDMPQLGYYFRGMMGDPVEQAELWRDRSAVMHAAKLQAHMLMMHGVNDPRCPVNQAGASH